MTDVPAHRVANPELADARITMLIRSTSAAAAAAVPLVGSGDGMAVDGAAVRAMRRALADAPFDGRVVVGEGEKDEAPMLHLGERFGAGGPAIDLAVDPVDGTRLAAAGRPGAMAVAAAAPRGAFFDLGPAHYLEKLVTWWPDGATSSGGDAGPRDILDRLPWLVAQIAATRGGDPSTVRVAVQDRPRNAPYAEAARSAGATVEAFAHGDIERSLRAAQRHVGEAGGIDVLVGIGGAPEGVIVSAGVRALGGSMRARLAPQSDRERERVAAHGAPTDRVLALADLCAAPAELVFAAVTDCDVGGLVEGARPIPGGGVRTIHWIASRDVTGWTDVLPA